MMNERERLIKLLDDGCYAASEEVHGRRANEVIADYLLKHGVIVPFVNVGDTVYIHGKPVDVSFIHVDNEDCYYCVQLDCSKRDCSDCNYCNNLFTRGTHGYIEFTVKDINKTVFLTREEAEKALKERETVDSPELLKGGENND